MSGADEVPKGLGDILGEHLAQDAAAAAARKDTPEGAHRDDVRLRYDFDADLTKIAAAWGEDPAEVLREFHRDTALARLMRKIFLVGTDPYDADVLAYLLELRVRETEGLVGKPLWRRVAEIQRFEHPNRNAAPENDAITKTSSLKSMARRGQRRVEAREPARQKELVRQLIAMFSEVTFRG